MNTRGQVLWLGSAAPPSFADSLQARRLSVVNVDIPSEEQLASSRAAIFDIPKYSGEVAKVLTDEIPRCLTHGVRAIIRAESRVLTAVQGRLAEFPGRWLAIDPSRHVDDIAEEARDTDFEPGPSCSKDLVIRGAQLNAEDLTLVQRAFSDCEDVELLPLTDGKSAAKVFRVHARFARRAPGAFTLPFLAKIDTAKNIELEINNFRQYVSGHVPFSQRPNLANDRSLIGAKRGIIVGDFVEDAVSLSRVCSWPEGRTVIYSIFDDALRSWRRHAYADNDSTKVPLTDLLPDVVRPDQIPKAVVDKAQYYGLKSTPTDLYARLVAVSTHHYRRGIIHGDLHPGNVMVRGAEAILIDFFGIWDSAPLVADVACLEVALCFTTAAEEVVRSPTTVKQAEFSAWRKTVDLLYSEACLRYVPPLQEPPSKHSWLWSACRQTRAMAHQVGADGAPYACALVVYLMRRARLGSYPGENASIAGYALRTAEKVLACIEAGRFA